MPKTRFQPVIFKGWLTLGLLLGACSVAIGQSVEGTTNGVGAIIPPVLRLEPLKSSTDSPVITALAIHPNGKVAAAAGDDHAIRVFQIAGADIPYPKAILLEGHKDWVQGIEFSPDGKLLASCAKDGTLHVWERSDKLDSDQKEWEHRWSHQVSHALFTLKFTKNGSLFAAGFSPSIYRLDLKTWNWQVDHQGDASDIRGLAISERGDYLAYGGRDGIVRIRYLAKAPQVDQDKGELPAEGFQVLAHSQRIRGLCFSSDDTMLYSVGEDRRLVGISIATRVIQYQNELEAGRLMALERLEQDRFAISGSDNTIRIVQPMQSSAKVKLIGHDGTIAVLRASQDTLLSGGFDTTIRSWSIESVLSRLDSDGRFLHPVSAQYEDSSAREKIR